MTKELARRRRGAKTKAKLRYSDKPRLVVYRSNTHTYVQLVQHSDKGDIVLAGASTADKGFKEPLKGNKTEKAKAVGELLAQRAKEKNITEISFDRNGYQYHGRIKALADAARDGGLIF